MKITRKIFINRRNGQASLVIPKKIIEQLKTENKIKKNPKKISFEILNIKKVKHGNNK